MLVLRKAVGFVSSQIATFGRFIYRKAVGRVRGLFSPQSSELGKIKKILQGVHSFEGEVAKLIGQRFEDQSSYQDITALQVLWQAYNDTTSKKAEVVYDNALAKRLQLLVDGCEELQKHGHATNPQDKFVAGLDLLLQNDPDTYKNFCQALMLFVQDRRAIDNPHYWQILRPDPKTNTSSKTFKILNGDGIKKGLIAFANEAYTSLCAQHFTESAKYIIASIKSRVTDLLRREEPPLPRQHKKLLRAFDEILHCPYPNTPTCFSQIIKPNPENADIYAAVLDKLENYFRQNFPGDIFSRRLRDHISFLITGKVPEVAIPAAAESHSPVQSADADSVLNASVDSVASIVVPDAVVAQMPQDTAAAAENAAGVGDERDASVSSQVDSLAALSELEEDGLAVNKEKEIEAVYEAVINLLRQGVPQVDPQKDHRSAEQKWIANLILVPAKPAVPNIHALHLPANYFLSVGTREDAAREGKIFQILQNLHLVLHYLLEVAIPRQQGDKDILTALDFIASNLRFLAKSLSNGGMISHLLIADLVEISKSFVPMQRKLIAGAFTETASIASRLDTLKLQFAALLAVTKARNNGEISLTDDILQKFRKEAHFTDWYVESGYWNAFLIGAGIAGDIFTLAYLADLGYLFPRNMIYYPTKVLFGVLQRSMNSTLWNEFTNGTDANDQFTMVTRMITSGILFGDVVGLGVLLLAVYLFYQLYTKPNLPEEKVWSMRNQQEAARNAIDKLLDDSDPSAAYIASAFESTVENYRDQLAACRAQANSAAHAYNVSPIKTSNCSAMQRYSLYAHPNAVPEVAYVAQAVDFAALADLDSDSEEKIPILRRAAAHRRQL